LSLSRSEQMSQIRGQNTKPELLLRSALWAKGFRYRLGYRTAGSAPDLVFLKRKVAVFVDGCFWHGCPEHYVRPRSSAAFWSAKLIENVLRDSRQTLALEQAGWNVFRVWEHDLFVSMDSVVEQIESALRHVPSAKAPEWRVLKVSPREGAGDMESRELVELRDLSKTMTVQQKRSTKKW